LMICNAGDMRERRRPYRVARDHVTAPRRHRDAMRPPTRRARTPFVKWSRCFLSCAVVIRVQCASIRDATDMRHPPWISWLGGQQWRNVERRQ
jgi:hypothetical protein